MMGQTEEEYRLPLCPMTEALKAKLADCLKEPDSIVQLGHVHLPEFDVSFSVGNNGFHTLLQSITIQPATILHQLFLYETNLTLERILLYTTWNSTNSFLSTFNSGPNSSTNIGAHTGLFVTATRRCGVWNA